ncbi:unnamed protein product [Anisakis simplex]|uniref:GPI transamidase component PIG-S (inferred by orthology to a human protein) n=1 Tax=Anisakis simplex TaxID=6269 RepID=A0A0M3JZ91_ANISI|nr:unnamed protein product [Anisakis simplex]
MPHKETCESIEERRKRVFKLTENERKEERYRHLSALSFIVVMIVFGIPLWWHTTSTYRVPFRNFKPQQKIILPVSISNYDFTCWNCSSQSYLEPISDFLSSELQTLSQVDPLNLTFNIHRRILDSPNDLSSPESDQQFVIPIVFVPENEWTFLGRSVHLSNDKWTFVKVTAADNRKVILNIINDILIDNAHLSAIINRELKRRLHPHEVATLPANQQKRLIWDSAAQSADYIVQLIFAHASSTGSNDALKPSEIVRDIRRLAAKLNGITNLRISSEHLWDFDVSKWLRKDVQERWTLAMDQMQAIITEADHETSTVESSYPLLKLLIIDYDEPVIMLDQTGEDSNGVVVASWGAIVSCCGRETSSVSSSLIASLRILLGLDSELPYGASKQPSPVSEWELRRLKLRSFVDFSMNAMSSVRAIHMLIAQIDNIVINDEVADSANRAVELIENALNKAEQTGQLDIDSVVKGHELAQRAVNDQSLLALLYFPNDQKFAIYLPLFLPTLLPLLGSMFTLYKHWRHGEQ